MKQLHDIDRLMLKQWQEGVYTCFDFAADVYQVLTGVSIHAHINNMRSVRRLLVTIPRQTREPCFLHIKRRGGGRHIGVMLDYNKVLHLTQTGARYDDLSTVLREAERWEIVALLS